MAALNNATTQDGYGAAAALTCPATERLLMHVRNAAIYYQLGHGWGAVRWDEEVFAPPGTGSLERDCDAIRVRSAAANTPAQVTIEAVPRG